MGEIAGGVYRVSSGSGVALAASIGAGSDAGGSLSRRWPLWGGGGLQSPARAIVAANGGGKVGFWAVRRNV
jgi:hypothetical protein